MNTYSPT